MFNVAGQMFRWEPFLTGSQLLTGRSLASGETQEAKLVQGAGGVFKAAGDYLIQDGRQPLARSGDWAIFRAHAPFSSAARSSALPDLAPVDG